MSFHSSLSLGSLGFSQYLATDGGFVSLGDDASPVPANHVDFDPKNQDHFVRVDHALNNNGDNGYIRSPYLRAIHWNVTRPADEICDTAPLLHEVPFAFEDPYASYFKSRISSEPPCPFTREEMAAARPLSRKESSTYRENAFDLYSRLRRAGKSSEKNDPTGQLAYMSYTTYLFSRGRAQKFSDVWIEDKAARNKKIMRLSCRIRVVSGTGLKHHFVQTGTRGKTKDYTLYVTADVMETYSTAEFLALVQSYHWQQLSIAKSEPKTRHDTYKSGFHYEGMLHLSLGPERRRRFFERVREGIKTKETGDWIVLEPDIKHALEEAICVGDEARVAELIEKYQDYARGDPKSVLWVVLYARVCRAAWAAFQENEDPHLCSAAVKEALATYADLSKEHKDVPYVDMLAEEAQTSCLEFLWRIAQKNPLLKPRAEALMLAFFQDPETLPLPRWRAGHELKKLQKDKSTSLREAAIQAFADFFSPVVEVGEAKEGDYSQCVIAGWALWTHFEKRRTDLSDDELRLALRVCQKSFALRCTEFDYLNQFLGVIETAIYRGRIAVFDREALWGLRRVFSNSDFKIGIGNMMGHVSQRVAFLLKTYVRAVPEEHDELLRILSEDMPTWTDYWSQRAAVSILGDELSRDRASFDRWRAAVPMRRPDHSDSEAQTLLYADILGKNPEVLSWSDIVDFFEAHQFWALKEKLWRELIEPAIFKLKGERGLRLPEFLALRRFMEDSPTEAKYALFALAHTHGVSSPVARMAAALMARLVGPDFAGLGKADSSEAIKKGEESPVIANFPLHDEVRKILGEGPKRLLLIHNIKDGLGDELIRNVTLMEAFLAFNPELEIHLITARPFLYAHPRVKVIPWKEVKDIKAVMQGVGKCDAVINHISHQWPLFLKFQSQILNYLGENVPPLFIGTEKQDSMDRDAFQLYFVCLSGREVALKLGLHKSRMENVYETTHRLLAELGMPFFTGENRPREFSPLVALDNPTARAEWETHTHGNTERRPVALVNPFGGEGRNKGYVSSRDRRSVYHTMNDERELKKKIEALVKEGYFVAIAPNGFKWGKRKKARRIAARLPKRVRDFVTVLPEPKELLDQALKYFVSYANFISTVEGGMLHQAYNQGKPYEVAFFHDSGSQRWIPLGAGPRQNVFVPS